MSIEHQFDIGLVAAMALKEKQIQQNYRPIIAVHKWFARRPGTLFRGLILSEFGDRPLADNFFKANDFSGRIVADPFMGGGTPLLEANRVGCDVRGFDINPMAAWIVREEIEHLDLEAYRTASHSLIKALTAEIGAAYRTDCPLFGDRNVPVKYFLWVKTADCERCKYAIDLFPGYLIADDTRHPKHVLVCSGCGELNEVDDKKRPGQCRQCNIALKEYGPARRNRCTCPSCGHVNSYPRPEAGPPQHRMFAIEYHNPQRRHEHRGRFFKKPDAQDLGRYRAATDRWMALVPRFVPDQEILSGDETDRLHRWGYRYYKQMFNERQLLGLELSCQRIAAVNDNRVRRALATNLSDLTRYQNMLCRYDTMALKSLDIFSVHGFPIGLVQCESNLLGISNGNGSSVGSGGWSNIVDKYDKAKQYCDNPFEVRFENGRKIFVPIKGEWIGERFNGARPRSVSIHCTSATTLALPVESLDAVFTDPPYFGNVQYGELMDFCYVWLRRIAGTEAEGFERESTRSSHELTGNLTEARGLNQFAEGLSAVYQRMALALKPGAPLAFTFHHNRLEAYHAVGVAILDAGLVCSTTLPCPAEMGGSIHIHGTRSSIVDTVFVCRLTGRTKRSLLFESSDQLREIIEKDVSRLYTAGMTPTVGDIRCVTFGHLTRMTVWRLRGTWDASLPIDERVRRFAKELTSLADFNSVIQEIGANSAQYRIGLSEEGRVFELDVEDAISFEIPFTEVEANLEIFVDEVFGALQSEFLNLPKGEGFIDYSMFSKGYEALKATTKDFRDISPEPIIATIYRIPISFIVLRTILGFTPPEWAYITTQRSDVVVSQGAARSLDRAIRMAPLAPLRFNDGVTSKRLNAMVMTACDLLTEPPPHIPDNRLYRLDKADTRNGLASLQPLADLGVPYAMLLYERFLGRPFAGHRDSVSELIGDVLESAIEMQLAEAKISFRKTKRAERISGFDQAPDFIIPDEFNPEVVIEAKITEDDGTARDKVTRVQHLGSLAMQGRTLTDPPRFEVIACIAGRGFGQRREDMKKLLLATRGKVFTLQNIPRLIDCTRLADFRTR